jgi:hypothetical protein
MSAATTINENNYNYRLGISFGGDLNDAGGPESFLAQAVPVK